MNFPDNLLPYERDLFLSLNGSESEFLDSFMYLYSGKAVWIPLALFIIGVIVWRKNWRESLFILVSIALVVTLCDQFASGFCKPFFERFRPTRHPDFEEHVKIVFDYRGGLYGFISSHAANAFGFATFLSLLMRNRLLSITIFLWAALTAYTRIYLGVHFIADIIAGTLAGVVFGALVYAGYKRLRLNIPNRETMTLPSELYNKREKNAIAYAILLAVGVIFAAAEPLTKLIYGF